MELELKLKAQKNFLLAMAVVWVIFSAFSIAFLFVNKELAFCFALTGISISGLCYFCSKIPTDADYITPVYLGIIPFGFSQYVISTAHHMWFYAIEFGVFIIAAIVLWIVFISKAKWSASSSWVFRMPKLNTRAWIIYVCTFMFVIAMSTLFLLHNSLIATYLTFAFYVVAAQIVFWDLLMQKKIQKNNPYGLFWVVFND